MKLPFHRPERCPSPTVPIVVEVIDSETGWVVDTAKTVRQAQQLADARQAQLHAATHIRIAREERAA